MGTYVATIYVKTEKRCGLVEHASYENTYAKTDKCTVKSDIRNPLLKKYLL